MYMCAVCTCIYFCVHVLLQALGQIGHVRGVDNSGGVVVFVNGNIWTFNPLCVKLAEKEEQEEASGTETHLSMSPVPSSMKYTCPYPVPSSMKHTYPYLQYPLV